MILSSFDGCDIDEHMTNGHLSLLKRKHSLGKKLSYKMSGDAIDISIRKGYEKSFLYLSKTCKKPVHLSYGGLHSIGERDYPIEFSSKLLQYTDYVDRNFLITKCLETGNIALLTKIKIGSYGWEIYIDGFRDVHKDCILWLFETNVRASVLLAHVICDSPNKILSNARTEENFINMFVQSDLRKHLTVGELNTLRLKKYKVEGYNKSSFTWNAIDRHVFTEQHTYPTICKWRNKIKTDIRWRV